MTDEMATDENTLEAQAQHEPGLTVGLVGLKTSSDRTQTQEWPYPGLRPFDRGERFIFFGRDAQIDQLLDRLGRQRFLAVVGDSGSGKSSLVRAGLLDALEAGFLVKTGSRWRIATAFPRDRPIWNLAEALCRDGILDQEGSPLSPQGETESRTTDPKEVALWAATLRSSQLGLVQAVSKSRLPSSEHVLIVIDQFEELFRFRDKGDRDEADLFVKLLLTAVDPSNALQPIYVVLTMRSEYLGKAARFPGLPEALNQAQYLTPQLTREQRKQAIAYPARVFGGKVEEELIEQILNDMGPSMEDRLPQWSITDDRLRSITDDRLPLMQHVLMRMWSRACDRACAASSDATGDPTAAASGGSVVVTKDDYKNVGGFDKSLSKHADEIYGKLDGKKQAITEVLFRCLCERTAVGDTRRPTSLDTVASVAAAVTHDPSVSLEQVKGVVDVFRDPDVHFITPGPKEKLEPGTLLDISHESLIRSWEILQKRWLVSEAEKANYYHHIVQTARYWKDRKADLLKGTDLDEALTWWINNNPKDDWAWLYDRDLAHDNLTLVEEFLQFGKKEVETQRTFRQDSEVEPEPHRKKDKLDAIAAWEMGFKDLHDFWVVLPKFLGGQEEFRKAMVSNIKNKGTTYLYFLELNEEIVKLKKLARDLEEEMSKDGSPHVDITSYIIYIKMDYAVFSELLDDRYYWFGNPEENNAAGYEVLFDSNADPVSGRELEPEELERVVLPLKVLNTIATLPTKTGHRVQVIAASVDSRDK